MGKAWYFRQRLENAAQLVEGRLGRLFESLATEGTPPRLIEAMRHAALGGGKRLRPFLVLESAGLFGVPSGAALTTAAAVECVHCYSLVHDGLPAMDNDDLRRGQADRAQGLRRMDGDPRWRCALDGRIRSVGEPRC